MSMVFTWGYHKNSDSFEISKLKEPHTSHNPIVMQAHHQSDSDFVSNMMLTIVKAEISIKIATIQTNIHKDFFCIIYYIKKLG